MKRILVALAAVAALGPTPAFAGLAQEQSRETDTVVDMVTTPRSQRQWLGQYQTYGSQLAEGLVAQQPAADNSARIVPYPQDQQPLNRGR